MADAPPPARGTAAPHPPSPRRQRLQAALPLPAAPSTRALRRTAGGRRAVLFALMTVIAALLYWPAFEAKRNLPDALYGAALALPVIAALGDAVLSRAPFSRSLWIGAGVLPAAVFARVVFDGLRDPTSHNLWPFELAIAFGVALPGALVGAALAALWLRLRSRDGDAG
jgi:hypothetical protein